jgi:hypothetical protein
MTILDHINNNKVILAQSGVTIAATVITWIDQFEIYVRLCTGIIGIAVGILTLIKLARDLKIK